LKERNVKGLQREWVKGIQGEREGFKVDQREELKVEKGKG
jgi:hypothetical protein